jgi:uncharacterized membrane protein
VLIDGVDRETARSLPRWSQLCDEGLELTVDSGFPTVSLPIQRVLWTGLTQQQTGIEFLYALLPAPEIGVPGQVPGAAIGLVIVGPTAIDVLLGGGRFDADDVARTASVLSVFALGVPFESLGHLLSRAIYATHHTIYQVVASLLGFAVTIVGTLVLVDPLGVLAIPLGYSLGSIVRFTALIVVLLWRIRRMPDGGASDDVAADAVPTPVSSPG